MTEEITEVEKHWSARFRINGIINLFVELDESALDGLVPEGAKWGTEVLSYDDDGEPLGTRQKTVREFSPHQWPSINEGKVIMLCCAVERPTIRQKRFSESDADDWKNYAAAVWGVDDGDFMTHEEAQELINQNEESR